MNLIITKSGPEKSWYHDSVGQLFEVIEPPTWALGGDEHAYYIKHFENDTGQAMFVWKDDCELVPCTHKDSNGEFTVIIDGELEKCTQCGTIGD